MHLQVCWRVITVDQLTLGGLQRVCVLFEQFSFMFFTCCGSVGLWINGLVALAETVQGGEMDALVALLREKVSMN